MKEAPVPPGMQDLLEAIQLQSAGRNEEAEAAFRKILAREPNNAPALYSLGVLLLNSNRPLDAFQVTSSGIVQRLAYAPLWFVHGAILQALGKFPEALQSYDIALQVKPDYVEVWLNSGVLLRTMHRHKEAVERFNKVLEFDPNHAAALANCGILLTEFKQNEAAIQMFERLLSVKPDYDFGLGLLEYERMHICDWREFEPMRERIIEGIRRGERTCKTLALMALTDSVEDHYKAAKIFASHYCPPKPESQHLWRGERYRHDKIRIAYVSPDLREHPVGHLICGVFEYHDKNRFDLTAISLGIDDGSRIRERMLKVFDRFIDVRQMTAQQAAQLIRSLEIDILVDLGGYTADTRTEIMAYRPAPVQVNYLGYPGSMGVDYYDYIIADPHIIPREHFAFYTEKVAYLPETYLPYDASIQISERTPSRAECGLPEQGFVFCAFCHDYKINPPMFDVWMRLLKQVPGSVLWLVSRNELSQRNLQREAEARGVSGDRLRFAQRVPRVEDHLARYRQADLFLDTHPYNGHTTCADALMAGLPVVTYMGGYFAARVAGGLLQAMGLPELVTHSLAEYEALALRLATQPAELAALKAKVAANRSQAVLFDTRAFTRDLEAIYAAMWHEQRLAGHADEIGRKE